MFIEKIKTPGLSHLSYFVASGTEAFVVDPRRDVECYMELAQQHGCSITHIFETHRNEDLISGSPLLAKQSGAQVFHGQREDTPVKFAKETFDGEHFTIGNCEIQVLATP
ncbi:MAG: MBL fold metallo-hydrolase, partial [Gammaproteobacteria bacterium]|nr:MBL fold metallo-hydrolase [Gammaproteobacteria bacterium]NIR95785.1 MBL fold metallo-hydrolase [Gammaproteobacteria bacterium]